MMTTAAPARATRVWNPVRAPEEPRRWRQKHRVQVADLFAPDRDDQEVLSAFQVMASTPHTYLVATEHVERMRDFMHRLAWAVPTADERERGIRDAAYLQTDGGANNRHAGMPTPRPNVWLGAVITGQADADVRIPLLVDCPAARRFVVCDPLVAPVNLSAWMLPVVPCAPEDAPATWAEWEWPDWVPAEVREAVEGGWSEKQGRGPKAWLQNALDNEAHPFGAQVTGVIGGTTDETTGRFVHCWNNMNRLVHDDGRFDYSSFSWGGAREQASIHWVIVRGEAGRRARPTHPNWLRALAKKCRLANVPLMFEGWGMWAPAPWQVPVTKEPLETLTQRKTDAEQIGATHAYPEWGHLYGWGVLRMSHKTWSTERTSLPPEQAGLRPCRSRAEAGWILDDRTYYQIPKQIS